MSRIANQPKMSAERSWLNAFALIALIGVFLAAAVFSVARGYSSYDAVAIWAVKGYGIVQGEAVRAAGSSGLHGLAYPLNIPLLVGLFSLFGGDVLPGSKLLYPLFGLSLAISLYVFLRRRGLSPAVANISLLLIFTVPVIFLHMTIGYANLAFTTYLILGILWGVEGIQLENPRLQSIGGVLLGLASWTRAEGIGFSLAVVAALYLVSRWFQRGRVYLLAWIGPLAAIAGAWLLFAGPTLVDSHLGQAVSVFKWKVGQGELGLDNIYTILRVFLGYALDVETWGLIFPLSGLLLILTIRRRGFFRKPYAALLFASWLILAAVPVGLFFVRSFSRQDLTAFVGRAFHRAFFPGAILLVILAMVIFVRSDDDEAPATNSGHTGSQWRFPRDYIGRIRARFRAPEGSHPHETH